ncbi:MAG: hypothetical protein ACE5EI_09545 [Thermodesulfobacteriota bacterium]
MPRPVIGLFAAMAVLTASTAASGARTPERVYQNHWCARASGVTEFTLPDRTRVDCLTREFAVEVDFAHKWAEAVGQALYYSIRTEKRPGIVLIMEGDRDERFLERLRAVTSASDITLWTITPAELGP